MCAFQTTPNKDCIRTAWDLPILLQQHNSVCRGLNYFGMTGPEMRDILAWRSVLESWTSVEERPKDPKRLEAADRAAEQLNVTAFKYGLDNKLTLLRGDVEHIIISGMDSFGTPPPLSNNAPADEMKFSYDLHNLDFDGGLGFGGNKGKPRRIVALERLFMRQAGSSFTLFLTVNVRDTIGAHVTSFLENRAATENCDVLRWYAGRGDGEYDYKLKAAVPLFLRHHAESNNFDSFFYPAVSYDGYKRARMVHFVAFFSATNSVFPNASKQPRDVWKLPMLRCGGGAINLSSSQHPGGNSGDSQRLLQGAPKEILSLL